MLEDGCFTCRNTAAPHPPPRERILRTEHWRVAHATSAAIAGWLVLVPTVHIVALDELSVEAADELGPLFKRLTAAQKAVTGCERTYVALFAEAPGFAHLHFHVVPRAPDLDERYRGPGIFALLGRPEGAQIPAQEQDAVSVAIHHELAPGLFGA